MTEPSTPEEMPSRRSGSGSRDDATEAKSIVAGGRGVNEAARRQNDSQVGSRPPGSAGRALVPPGLDAVLHSSLLGRLPGVVHGFISKVAPGNFSIFTPDGQPQAFNHTGETVIRRDGRRVTIGQVRLGDLVRPNSRYRSAGVPPPGSGYHLVLLSLKSPGSARVQGTIRGIAPAPDGGTLVTVSNNWLEMITLAVNEETGLIMRGRAVGVDELELGLRADQMSMYW